MTGEQFERITHELRLGTPLDQAIRRAGVHSTDFDRELRENPQLEEVIDDCLAAARHKQKAARSYKDDPAPNDGDAPTFRPEEDEPTPCTDEGFQRAIKEASELGDGMVGQLAWIEKRCALAKRHPIDPVWMENYSRFFSGPKLICGILAGLRAGKTTSTLRAVIPGALFTRHKVEAGEIAGIPVMSAKTDLATMSLNETEVILCACGMSPSRKGAESIAMPGGVGGTYKRTNTSSGGGVIEFINAHGAKVRIMCLAANVSSAVGYTAIGAFLDETEIWRNSKTAANPANEVLEAVQQRATTTFDTAKLIVSSSYYPSVSARRREKGAHQQLIEAGDTDTVYIARLGELGARRDEIARRSLAALLNSSDPRLMADGDPDSPAIPAWASRTDLPILTLYKQAGGDIDRMLAVFGGRMDCGIETVDTGKQYELYAERNRQLCAPRAAAHDLLKFDGLPSWDPRSRSYGGRSHKPTL